jgi:hypothetical protein
MVSLYLNQNVISSSVSSLEENRLVDAVRELGTEWAANARIRLRKLFILRFRADSDRS